MLVGLKKFKSPSGDECITCDIQGSAEELQRVYNNEYVEVEIEDNRKDKNDERYNPETEEDFKNFVRVCCDEIDTMYVDEDDI